MPKIEGNDEVVSVKIIDVWVDKIMGDDGDVEKIIFKLKGEDAHGRHGIASVWMSNEPSRVDADKSEAQVAIEDFAKAGINPDSMADAVGVETTFYVKDKGADEYAYYFQPQKPRVKQAEVSELVARFRGAKEDNLKF